MASEGESQRDAATMRSGRADRKGRDGRRSDEEFNEAEQEATTHPASLLDGRLPPGAQPEQGRVRCVCGITGEMRPSTMWARRDEPRSDGLVERGDDDVGGEGWRVPCAGGENESGNIK